MKFVMILFAMTLTGIGSTVFADSITVVNKKTIEREVVDVQLKPINCKVGLVPRSVEIDRLSGGFIC